MAREKLKIGRNDPCPCRARNEDGTRKKYKKCCINSPSPFSSEQIHQLNKQKSEEDRREFAEFLEAHAKGQCYLCGLPYDQYDFKKPCSHWLLRPVGMKKDSVASVLEQNGCFRPQAFLRWLANTEALGTQINDFAADDPAKVFETTIRYKHFEWSFTCSNSDLAGHKDSEVGADPHFSFSDANQWSVFYRLWQLSSGIYSRRRVVSET